MPSITRKLSVVMIDYRFYNANPVGDIENDCVCRAISRATKLDYNLIKHKLELIADLFECDELTACCYNYLLTNVFGLKQRVATNLSVADLGELFPEDVILIRTDRHLTVVEYGVLYDIFDCRSEKADLFWIV